MGQGSRAVQRWRCKACGRRLRPTVPVRPMGSMRIDPERAALILGLLTEGSSIRSAERLTGTHRDTICRLLRFAGDKAEAALSLLVQRVEVKDVQADEIWGYVGMKEKTKVEQGISDPQVGDAYTFVGFERHSKLVLSWHLGRRTAEDTHTFMGKLAGATAGRFQLTTDGFASVPRSGRGEAGRAGRLRGFAEDLRRGFKRGQPAVLSRQDNRRREDRRTRQPG